MHLYSARRETPVYAGKAAEQLRSARGIPPPPGWKDTADSAPMREFAVTHPEKTGGSACTRSARAGHRLSVVPRLRRRTLPVPSLLELRRNPKSLAATGGSRHGGLHRSSKGCVQNVRRAGRSPREIVGSSAAARDGPVMGSTGSDFEKRPLCARRHPGRPEGRPGLP